jgi:hypothetical protein
MINGWYIPPILMSDFQIRISHDRLCWTVAVPRYVILNSEPTIVGHTQYFCSSITDSISRARQIRSDKQDGDPIFTDAPIVVQDDNQDINIDEISDVDLVHFILKYS